MTIDDAAAIDTVLRAAYGVAGSFRARIELYLRQRGALPLIAEYDGCVAGAVVGNDYTTSAYVALMGVDPALQRRGIGDALMAALMTWCDERGFRDVRLDATDPGAPLYTRFGFADFGATNVMEGAGAVDRLDAASVRPATAADAATIARLDAAAFGADRSPVLEQLLVTERAFLAPDDRGYVVVQGPSPEATIGPWIAADAGAASALLAAAIGALRGNTARLLVPSTNQAAQDLAAAAGFAPRRALRHMIRGAGATPSPAVFGRANLGQG